MSDATRRQEWRWRWRWRRRCCSHFALNSTSKRNLFSPMHTHTHAGKRLLTLSLRHTHTRWLTHARWELVARILSFVYALELFIHTYVNTLCVCVWVFLFFCGYSAFVTLLALCLSLPLSFWLIKWLSNAEWVCCWVACRLSAGQLSAALECCCFRARNISMSFTICLVYYCRSSFR